LISTIQSYCSNKKAYFVAHPVYVISLLKWRYYKKRKKNDVQFNVLLESQVAFNEPVVITLYSSSTCFTQSQ